MSGSSPRRDPRKVHVPAPGPGAPTGPPPRPGGDAAAPGPSVFAPAPAPAGPRPRPGPRPPAARPTPRPPASRAVPPSGPAGPTAPATRGRRPPRRPKLRRILLLTAMLLPVLLLLVALGGLLYARSVFNRIETIPLADVLSTGGDGTNYLIVGSDSRDLQDVIDAGLDPGAFEDGGGQRSDTMLLLRFEGGQAKMLSIPRDLYVQIAETGASSKINSAYNGGPRRLVLTIQDALQIPIQHYMEVDFVSFAKLVDSLGGITIDFPNPAFDRNSGLDVEAAGPVHLDGPQALAFVRSRHYVEVIDGKEVPDPTADLGRVQRQQQFLKAVFGELGSSKNPFTLAKAADSTTGGLRIDDTLGLVDAIRLAWRLRSLDPTSVELPVDMGRNSSGSVLFLQQPGANEALDQFR